MNDSYQASGSSDLMPAPPDQPERLSFAFTGSGSEYFRIWIVNLLLTIVTLSIYSAWAKVRRTKYFYRNTVVGGSAFEYHGNPVAILKGRLIALVVFAAYHFMSSSGSTTLLSLALLGVALTVPWLLWKSLQFKAFNTSWRGVRAGFGGSVGEAYKTFLMWPFLALISFYTLLPLAYHQIKSWQHTRARFGQTPFSMKSCVGGFYMAHLLALSVVVLLCLVVLGLSVSLAGGTGDKMAATKGFTVSAGVLSVILLLIGPMMSAKVFNMVWSSTSLGPHQFASEIPLGRAAYVGVTNLLGIVFTLGLFIPWAAVRWARLRASHLSVLAAGSLDNFTAMSQPQADAQGEGMADLAGFDLGL